MIRFHDAGSMTDPDTIPPQAPQTPATPAAPCQPVVITHHRLGIFVGLALGQAFWSMVCAAGQTRVIAFASEADARRFVAMFQGLGHSPEDYRYIAVNPGAEGVTLAALHQAGLGHLTGQLRENTLAAAECAGSA